MNVDNASLMSHNPFSTKASKAWQADILSVTFVLSFFVSNNLNSDICLNRRIELVNHKIKSEV